MRGSLGLVIGVAVGAGGMYLALRPPWVGGQTPRPPLASDAISSAPVDAGVKRKKKRVRRPPNAPPNAAPGEDEEFIDETAPPELTAADRKMEWRGDDVALPATKIDMSAGGEARKLDDGEINSVIAAQAGPVRDCVVRGATNTDLRASISVKLVVDGSGRVTKSRVHAPHYLFEQGLLACTQRALAKMRFPATGAPTLVTLPVDLR